MPALSACENLASQLRGLADTGAALATSSRRAHDAGLVPRPAKVNPEWEAPWGLDPRNPRPGPIAPWQPLDRAFAALTAVLDDPSCTLADRAVTYHAPSTAAGQLADALESASRQELATCSFCGKRPDQVRRVIAGPRVFICDECVELCVEALNEG